MPQGFHVPLPQRLFDANGDPAVGWKVYTFVAGTSTPILSYLNADLSTANTHPIVTDASGYFRIFVAEAVIIDIDVQNAASVPQFSYDGILAIPSPGFVAATSYNRTGATDSNGTYATATLTSPTVTGNATSGVVVAKRVTFTENATSIVHTATIPIPAGATLHDIQTDAGALWGAAAAVLKAGDTDDDDGYFIGIDLKATDLLVGEQLSLRTSETWAGKQGAYLVAATGRRGPVATNFGGKYLAGSNILITITVTTPATTVGRTYVTVLYSVGETITPTLA